VAVPRQTIVLLLVCLRALQRWVDIKAAVDTHLAWFGRIFELFRHVGVFVSLLPILNRFPARRD